MSAFSPLDPNLATRIVAPPASALPAFPLSWYPFCSRREVESGPVSRELAGRRIVVYRTADGRLVALDAHCAHLGADLGRGRVRGECIQCPFHHWEYGPDGGCRKAPGSEAIPSFARQRQFTATERHGQIFVFNAAQPLFPLPFFEGCDPTSMAGGRLLEYEVEVSWHMFASNLFDETHLECVHGRRPLAGLNVDTPHPCARRVSYDAEIVPSTRADRALRWLSGGQLSTEITCWGGTFFVGTGELGGAKSWILVMNVPRAGSRSLRCLVRVYVPHRDNRVADLIITPMQLMIRRWFADAFMLRDFDQIMGAKYRPDRLTAADRPLLEFFDWAAHLPRSLEETE